MSTTYQYSIEDILARVDIVELIQERVPLKRMGHRFVARCRFIKKKRLL